MDSSISFGVYAVSTNAATMDNYNIIIDLQNSAFTSNDTQKGDRTPVLINVPGTLNMDGGTVTGSRKGVTVRGCTATITRQQLVAMLYRYAGSTTMDYGLTYSDVHKISDYAVDAMRWATATGIINGKTDGAVIPKARPPVLRLPP